MLILVCGAKGMLGTDLIPILKKQNHEIILTDIEELDITNLNKVEILVQTIKPAMIINCAGYTQVDKAETEQDKAFLINETGTRNLAQVSKDFSIDLCHISTDYIFNGQKETAYLPDDPPDPLNFYGRSKLAGENHIRQLCNTYYIIRTSWLYGKQGQNFVRTILRLADSSPEVRVVNDQFGLPTWTVTLSHIIAELITTKRYGIYHASDDTHNKGISWFQFAQEIIFQSHRTTAIIPITSDQYPCLARRPKNSVLDLSLIKSCLTRPIPCWKESLALFLKSIL